MQRRRRAKPARRREAATSSDVLGTARATPEIRPKFRGPHRRLEELRDSLIARQNDLARDAAEEQPSFSQHMADAGTDSFDRDLALSMMSSEQDALYQIEQALDRIRNGTYGICELTGKPIEPERLEAIPWTRFSAEAERQLEKSGARPRTRLKSRDPVTREPGAAQGEDSA